MKPGIICTAGLMSLFLLSACATQSGFQERPGWISGQAAEWPDNRYLTGRGAAPVMAQAENRARAALALVLEARIETEIQDLTRFEKRDGGQEADRGRVESRVSRNIVARTSQVIRGIEIADIWQDPGSGEYHALAVLDRARAERMLRRDIQRLDQMTALQIERSRANDDPLSAIAAASHAVEAQTERLGLQKMLQVIDRSGRGAPPQWALARLSSDRDALIARVAIQARAPGGNTAHLQSRLTAALARAGFRIPGTEDETDYILTVNLDVDNLGRLEGWFWLKGTLSLVLQDSAGRERGARHWDIKQSGRDPRLARRRVMDQVNMILDEELRDAIIGFAEPE